NTILYLEKEDRNNSKEHPIYQDKNYINITFKDQWSAEKSKHIGLSTMLNGNHLLFQDLYKTYSKYFGSRSAILNRKIKFYNNIMYTVLNFEGSTKISFTSEIL
ncbi:2949_t:CDS:1, partial [Dentiscutata heterogama]